MVYLVHNWFRGKVIESTSYPSPSYGPPYLVDENIDDFVGGGVGDFVGEIVGENVGNFVGENIGEDLM